MLENLDFIFHLKQRVFFLFFFPKWDYLTRERVDSVMEDAGEGLELGLESVGMMLMRTRAWDLYQVKAGGW